MIDCETLKSVTASVQRGIFMAQYNQDISHCKRRHVGAVLMNQLGEFLGSGWNGDHIRNPYMIRGTCAPDAVGKCGCMHAELRALLSISRIHVYPNKLSTPTVMVVSTAPCLLCAQAILDVTYQTERSGPERIEKVYFWEESTPGIEGVAELLNYGVQVYRVPAPVSTQHT